MTITTALLLIVATLLMIDLGLAKKRLEWLPRSVRIRARRKRFQDSVRRTP